MSTSAPRRAKTTAASTAGSFADKPQSAPEVGLNHIPTDLGLSLDKTARVYRVWESDHWAVYSSAEIRERLGFDADAPESDIEAVFALMADQDYPPYVYDEPLYDLSGGDGTYTIPSTEWPPPPVGEWGERADVHVETTAFIEDGETVQRKLVTVTADIHYDLGADTTREAATRAAIASIASLDADDIVVGEDGRVSVPLTEQFASDTFAPSNVAESMSLSAENKAHSAASLKQSWDDINATLLASDDELAAADRLDPQVVAAATRLGHLPNDVEAIALAKAFRKNSEWRWRPAQRLAEGWLTSDSLGALRELHTGSPDDDPNLGQYLRALRLWAESRP